MTITEWLSTQPVWISVLVRVFGALGVLLLGRWLAGRVRSWVRVGLQRTHVTASLLEIFSRSSYYFTLLVTIFLALVILGIPAEVLITVIGVVVIIAAIALRESLRDVAATVIFFIFQPFRSGDLIETNGITGRAQEILLFSTVIITLDNRKIVVPNGNIQNTNLINYSAMDKVRLDITQRLTYTQDLRAARKVLLQIAESDERSLREPPPVVDVMDLQADGVYLVLRVQVKPDDFFALRPALTERIKLEFDANGISFAMPQLDVRTVNGSAGG